MFKGWSNKTLNGFGLFCCFNKVREGWEAVGRVVRMPEGIPSFQERHTYWLFKSFEGRKEIGTRQTYMYKLFVITVFAAWFCYAFVLPFGPKLVKSQESNSCKSPSGQKCSFSCQHGLSVPGSAKRLHGTRTCGCRSSSLQHLWRILAIHASCQWLGPFAGQVVCSRRGFATRLRGHSTSRRSHCAPRAPFHVRHGAWKLCDPCQLCCSSSENWWSRPEVQEQEEQQEEELRLLLSSSEIVVEMTSNDLPYSAGFLQKLRDWSKQF